MFKGYSFVAPSVIFSENSVSADFLQRTKDNQPDSKAIYSANIFNVICLPGDREVRGFELR